jgi:hypothetical protein
LVNIFACLELAGIDMALCRQNIEAKEVIGKIFWNKDLAGLVDWLEP